jgi:DNA polymerase-3 subunit delta
VLVREFVETFPDTTPAPVYVFAPHKPPRAREASYEPVLAERAAQMVVDRLVDPSMRDLCFSAFYADETSAREVVETANTLPFLVERRVVLVRNAERYQSEAAGRALFDYLENPCESTVLVLLANPLDKRLKLYRACEKAAVLVECPRLQEHEAALWVRQEIEARGKQVDAAAVGALTERTGTSLADINNAVALVCGYVTGDTVTADDVAAACADTHEEEVWALTDAIARSDTPVAVRVLREIVDPNKNEFQILGSLNWLLRSAYGVAAGGDAKKSVKPFVARKVQPLADKLGAEKFPAAFRLCVETDLMMRSTGVDRSLALELLVVKLAAPRRRAAAH